MNDKRVAGQGMSEPVMSDDELHEDLSAFMDGELDADRARFLQQRLSHDAALRARWERWQLLSSSMRRQAQPLPAGFAERIAHAIEADAVAVAPTRGRALRWAGGTALAASLAVAGVFVFDATHQPQRVSPQVATAVATPAAAATILPIERTVLPLPEPVVELPIPVQSGVVTAFRSPLHTVLLREQAPRAVFAPFPQPYAVDPELEAYLQRQKTGATHDVFAEDAANRAGQGNGAVRTVAWPQDNQH
jgi:sigma-E factor negative regulatory protein RseA